MRMTTNKGALFQDLDKGPPNTGMEPTPLCGEQDRGDFES